jgi:hypothetical protein
MTGRHTAGRWGGNRIHRIIELVTVTHRRRVEKKNDPANDGRSSRDRLCRSCDTSFDVRIEAPGTVVFDVRGGTCQDCNPHRHPPPDQPSGDRLVTIIPIWPSGGPPRVETLSEDVGDMSAEYRPERIVQTPRREAMTDTDTDPTKLINSAWREAVEPIVSAGLGEEDWRAIDAVWQAELCEWVEAIAAALDDVWESTVPMVKSTRVVLNLPALPAAVATLIVKVVQRSVVTVRTPAPMTGAQLRSVGIACCAGTGRALTCGRLHRELETISENPDPGVLRVIAERLDRPSTTIEVSIADYLQRLATRPHRPVDRIESPVDERAGPLKRSRTVTARVIDGPKNTAIFGDAC